MNIKELLSKSASLYSDKPAVIFEEKRFTFSEVRDCSFKLANYLLKRGVKEADKIGVFLPNIPEAVFAHLGIFSIGATLIPLDFMLTEGEIINLIQHSDSDILIAQPKKGVDFRKVKNECLTLKEIILCKERMEGFSWWNEIVKESSPQPPSLSIDEDSLSAILYTSGSTGHPKGVMLTYKNFDSPLRCIEHFLQLSSEDIILCGGVPLSHIGGIDYILLMLYFTQTLILMERFQPLEFLKKIEKHKVTLFWIVPSMYVAILSLKEYDKFDLSSLRYAVVFGAPSSPILLKRFHKVCPNAYLLNGWGMTETTAPNCVLPPGKEKIESVGKFATGTEAKIVDEEGEIIERGKQGELWVKGQGVMRGYYKEPQLTKEVLSDNGWLRTGDIAYCDEEGFFYIAGRKKDMIKVAGEVVFPPEIEEIIQRHPKIKEVAVIGVIDKLRGEVPKAFIVLKEAERLSEQELKEFLKEHLAHFKVPHHFEFVKSLPRTRTGKIDKQAFVSIKSR
jgi:acyl-CoA synthetase (AMP-forming)/AMP-acid ligase II